MADLLNAARKKDDKIKANDFKRVVNKHENTDLKHVSKS
jgi:hypothetical protein